MPKILLITTCKFCITNSFQKKLLKYRLMHQKLLVTKKPLVGIIMGSSSDSRIMHGAAEILDSFSVAHEDQIISAHRTPQRLDEYAKHAEKNQFKVIIAGAGGAAHLPGMIASHTTIPVIGVPIMVYNDKQMKKTDKNKYSAFGGLDSLLSISEMPTGSPVVAVGVNKASNAGIYALKILGNSYPEIKKKLKKHKFDQYTSVLKESEELKKIGLSKFVKKKFR
jgi:5-(carboxyamino)imidazole ribonucleotide mutase|tara:strand:+ start:148 stop:816 length:669 start_codon:yes stop_codon:yes gene_type:complete